jgi:2-C-methyl-D-erythritol 2,4-cyclodiphosphate synthase
VAALMRERGFRVGHLDATVIAEEPRLAPHQAAMRAAVAGRLGAPAERINIKVKSTDGLGTIGRGEGIAAQAVVVLEPEGEASG